MRAADRETLLRVVAELREGSPDLHARWWYDLPDSEQEAAVELTPRAVGSLTGLPGSVLDRVLRASLPGHFDELTHEKRRVTPTADPGAIQRVTDKIESLEELMQTLAEPERMLLGLGLEGERAKAAVAVGDVDTATHIGVYTPGMGSTVHGCISRYDDEMDRLRQRTIGLGLDEASVATVTWLGYEAPLGVTDVIQRRSALAGSQLLRRFTEGMRSPREDRFHLTAIGHSYGSTTTAMSLLATEHRIDDAVFFGSPGLGTNNVADLGLPPRHVFLLEAKGDPVADLGYFGDDPNQLADVVILSTGPSDFGDEVTGHANYLNENSTSQYNIATVLSGQPQLAVEGMVLGFGDRVRRVLEVFDRD